MNLRIQIAGLLMLSTAGMAAEQVANKAAQAVNNVAPNGGVPKGPLPKGVKLVNPDAIATRLFRMTPTEREVFLSRMRPAQLIKARNLLDWYDHLPKDQQEMQLRRLDRFEKLTPEKKMEVRQATLDIQALRPARRRQVVMALFQLQNLTDQERELTLHRPMFVRRFTPEELKLINSLADAWMGPPDR